MLDESPTLQPNQALSSHIGLKVTAFLPRTVPEGQASQQHAAVTLPTVLAARVKSNGR